MNPGLPFAGAADTAPTAGAEDIVQLDQNHPGFRDPEYRAAGMLHRNGVKLRGCHRVFPRATKCEI